MFDVLKLTKSGTPGRQRLELLATLTVVLPTATCMGQPVHDLPKSPYDVSSLTESPQESAPTCDRTDGVACEGE
jgi:hypothetical protein